MKALFLVLNISIAFVVFVVSIVIFWSALRKSISLDLLVICVISLMETVMFLFDLC